MGRKATAQGPFWDSPFAEWVRGYMVHHDRMRTFVRVFGVATATAYKWAAGQMQPSARYRHVWDVFVRETGYVDPGPDYEYELIEA